MKMIPARLSKTKTSARARRNRRSNAELLLLVLPAALVTFIFSYMPMPGLILAFKKFDPRLGIFNSPGAGFTNFKFLFQTGHAWRITRNAVFINVLFIIFGTIVAVIIALLIFELTKEWLVKVYHTTLILPNFISWIVAGFMAFAVLNYDYGVLNRILTAIGLERVNVYTKPEVWPGILTIAHLWKNVGMGSVLYYSTLVGVDSELYEAASIDGATRLQKMRFISIPSLIPMITILFIMNMGRIINSDFGLFYFITRDVNTIYRTTDVVDTFVYRMLMRSNNISKAAAAGFFPSIVGFVMVLVTNLIVRRIEPDNSLF
jgi:putative aldouronate transport system permease protein